MIPSQIKAQEERADELMKGLQPAAEAKAADGEETPTPEPEKKPEAQKESTPPPVQTEDYRDRYMTLQGKYNAEIPRLQQQLRDMQAQLQAQTERTQKPDAETRQEGADSFNLEEIGEYGEDFKKMGELVKRLETENNKLRGQVDAIGNDVKTSQTQTAHNAFLNGVSAQLSAKGHNLQTLNSDPKLLEWLKESDGTSGQTRHQSLRSAQSSQSVERTMAIFNAYLNDTQIPKQQAQQRPNVQPPVTNAGTDVNPQLQPQGRTWKREDISAFYRAKTDGRYSGEEGRKKAALLEADIFAAQREGRIVQ